MWCAGASVYTARRRLVSWMYIYTPDHHQCAWRDSCSLRQILYLYVYSAPCLAELRRQVYAMYEYIMCLYIFICTSWAEYGVIFIRDTLSSTRWMSNADTAHIHRLTHTQRKLICFLPARRSNSGASLRVIENDLNVYYTYIPDICVKSLLTLYTNYPAKHGVCLHRWRRWEWFLREVYMVLVRGTQRATFCKRASSLSPEEISFIW